VHRDIKPSNVVITAGRTVLLDYGLTMGDGGTVIEMAGTAGYIAPELLADSRATRKCDLYSIGMLFHRALLGRLPSPNERKNPAAMKPHIHAPDEADEFLDLLPACIESDPQARPELEELVDALERISSRESRNSGSFKLRKGEQTPLPPELEDHIESDHSLSVIHGPPGSGHRQIVASAIDRWKSAQAESEVIRVNAAGGRFQQLAEKLIHIGAEQLSGFESHSDVPIRALRISNQLALQYPVLEASLEELGMPRVLSTSNSAPSGGIGESASYSIAQWLRALFQRRTWLLALEDLDLNEPETQEFVEALQQRGEFSPPGATVISTLEKPGFLQRIDNTRLFACKPERTQDLAEWLRESIPTLNDEAFDIFIDIILHFTKGYIGPSHLLIRRLANTLQTTTNPREANAKTWSRREATELTIEQWMKPISHQARVALWLISTARTPFRHSWLSILSGNNTDSLIAELRENYLIQQKFKDGETHYVPFSVTLGQELVNDTREWLQETATMARYVESLEVVDLQSHRVAARLFYGLGLNDRATESYHRAIRLLLRSGKHETALRMAEELMSQMELKSDDVRMIASVFVHCRRPLDAAILVENFAKEHDAQLDGLARAIRVNAGDRRQSEDEVQSDEPANKLKPTLSDNISEFSRLLRKNSAWDWRDLIQRLQRSQFVPLDSVRSQFSEVHPSISDAYELFRKGLFRRVLEALTRDFNLELDRPETLPSFLRLRDYLASRARFFVNLPIEEQVIVAREGSQPFEANERFQTANAYINAGWLTDLQSGELRKAIEKIEHSAEILESFRVGPDQQRLIAEARSIYRVRDGSEAASDIVPWPSFSSQLVSLYTSAFFRARSLADESFARKVLQFGFRQAYHGGGSLIATMLLMVFGELKEEREHAERVLRKAGWHEPEMAICLILGISREELYQLKTEIPMVEGIHLPLGATFNVHSFVGSARS
jgi:tetratricopeptide (TPR) repeat protein